MSSYIPVTDPFLSKGPIRPNASGFYQRDEVFIDVQNLLIAGESVSVVGERKAGKTSFLYYLLAHLSNSKFIPVFVDAQRVAPKTDKMFLGYLARNAARAIAKATSTTQPIRTNTLRASPEEIYMTFEEDIEALRAELPQGRCLIWLIDEIEILQSYQNTNLFNLLRSLVQHDPDFQLVVAGYDVLYMLSSDTKWSPFFNAFTHLRLRSLNELVATRLIDDAATKIDVTIDPDLIDPILEWTGQKPFFLKWVLSTIAKTLNRRQIDRDVRLDVLQNAKNLFLTEPDLSHHFDYHWSRLTQRQQIVLSLIASQDRADYNHPIILDNLKEKRLIKADQQASSHLIDDLRRLDELSFLYKQVRRYTFTSLCLKNWIRENKPLF